MNNKNQFDYTSVPGELLYSKKRYLDDFDVEDPQSLNFAICEQLYDRFSGFVNYEDFACEIFNVAYYILTMIVADSHPERRFGAYVKKALDAMHNSGESAGSILAIVWLYLHFNDMWKEDKLCRLRCSIEKELEIPSYNGVCKNIIALEKRVNVPSTIVPPLSSFSPRPINKRILMDTREQFDWCNTFQTDTEKMLMFIFAIGKTEDEQKVIAEFLRRETHSAFDNGDEHKWCFDGIERDIYLHWHGDEERAKIDAEIEADAEAQAILEIEAKCAREYAEENAKLRAKTEELEKQLKNLQGSKMDGITQEEFDKIFDSRDDNRQTKGDSQHEARIKELEADLKSRDKRNAEKDAKIASLQKQLAEERQKRQNLIDDFSDLDEVQKMSLHQKIVFFTTVTSVLLDKRYTNMRNLASFIASMCNEKAKTIGPMLSRIGQITDENPNPQLSSTLNTAAQSVSDMLLSVLTDATKNDETQIINKIRENLLLNYPSPEDE